MEFAFDENVARGAWGSLQQFAGNAELGTKFAECMCAAETLGTKFQQKAVARDGIDDAAGARGGFEKLRINTGFAKAVGANEARDATADYECWDATSHKVFEKSGLETSCCFSRYGSKTMARLRMKMRPSQVARISPLSSRTRPSSREGSRRRSSSAKCSSKSMLNSREISSLMTMV